MDKKEIIDLLDNLEDRVNNIEWDLYQMRLRLQKERVVDEDAL